MPLQGAFQFQSADASGRFQVRVAANYQEMSQWAARFLLEELRIKPDLLLCAATGASPLRTYQLLAEHRDRFGPAPFSRLRVLKLDEWGGLEQNDPATCEIFLRTHLLNPLHIGADRYAGFASNPEDPAAECLRVHVWLAESGPLDICILGLGPNGHLALNEPAETLPPFAHASTLSGETLRHPMLSAARGVPRFGLTLGLAEILGAHKILLLVSGAQKQTALRRLLHTLALPSASSEGISTHFPASFLALHPAVTCLCDQAAIGGQF
jgi:putative deaminase/isomerase